MRWLFPAVNHQIVLKLSSELNLSPLLARLLVIRGIRDADAAHHFLQASLSDLHDPYLMADMDSAVARLRTAIERREKILIYGDYDVDGTMAVVVLMTALKALGATVETYIPHRTTDGYGMRVPVIEKAAAEHCGVVLSVDTGIRAHEVIGRARELGVDCIVTDHHLPEATLPSACAILNPHRTDCGYPEKNLSGVGVAFKLVQALFAGSGRPLSDRHLASYLKVVALGTIADVVPLSGENRVIAQFGLAGLREPVHYGLSALMEVAGLRGRAVTAGHVGFRLAPRLNAAGRMESARDVIDLLTTADVTRAREIAERLDQLNRERQITEEQIINEIVDSIEAPADRTAAAAETFGLGTERLAVPGTQRLTIKDRSFLVFAGRGWHRGVIGIVAQRMVDRYYRPTLVISIEEPARTPAEATVQAALGYGSGRSIPGFHLLEALDSARDLFDRYGGHAQAAGFTLQAHRIEELGTALDIYARGVLMPKDLQPAVRVDAQVSLQELDWKFSQELKKLEPFGLGNPTPVFAARGIRIVSEPRVIKERHLKMRLSQGPKSLDGLVWGGAKENGAESNGSSLEVAPPKRLREGEQIDVAFNFDENVFEDLTELRLVIKDIR